MANAWGTTSVSRVRFSPGPGPVAQLVEQAVPRTLVAMTKIAVANAGRNYSLQSWMVWQVRLLLGIRSLARAGPSGFVHPRRRCDPPAMQETTPANAGRTTGRAARRISGGQVGCSNHPVFPKGARSSVNRPAKSRRRDDGKALGECRR